MQKIALLAAFLLCAALLPAQSPQYFFKTLDCDLGTTMCFDADSNLWLGCVKNGQPLLVKMSREGILLEQVPINTQAGNDNPLTELIVDSEGMIVGCGTAEPINPNDPESSFAFRYDPQNRQMLWSRKVADGYLFLSGIVENGPGGHFWAYGYNYGFSDIGDMLLLDRHTGALVPGYARAYRIGNSEDIRSVLYHKDKLYATGQNDLSYLYGIGIRRYLRQNLACLDTSGLPAWNLLGSVPFIARSYLQGQDLLVDNDTLISLSSGNDQNNTTTVGHIFLQKTTLDGTLIWLKKYDLSGLSLDVANALVAVSDGYVILVGQNTLVKVDKAGSLVWAQRLSNLSTGLPLVYGKAQNQLLTDGKALYLITTDLGKAAFIKLDLNGNIAGCNRLSPITVLPLPLADPFFEKRTLSAQEATTATSIDIPTELPAPAQMGIQVVCQNEGPAPQNPCEPRTFLKQLGDSGLRQRITSLLAVSDTALYLAGQHGELAMLSKMRPDGELLWTESLSATLPLSVTDLLLDAGDMLIGCGHQGDAASGRTGFMFRYDPAARKLLWLRQLSSPIVGGGSIAQVGSAGNQIVLHHTLLLPDGRRVPESLLIERSTGNIVPLSGRRYDLEEGNESITGIAPATGDDLYAIGQRNLASGATRTLLANLTPSIGGLKWMQLGHTDTTVTGSTGGQASVIFDSGKAGDLSDDYIVSAYVGQPSADPNAAPTQLFLQKNTPLGTVVWVRRFDLPTLGDVDLLAVPGGYVVFVKTAAARYSLLKTDLNGNLLTSKQVNFGTATGGSIFLEKTQHRATLLGGYIFFALHDGRAEQDLAFLLKTDLNLEVQGPCGAVSALTVATGNVTGPLATRIPQGLYVEPLAALSLPGSAQPDELSVTQLCPPIISVPRLALGPDLALCPGDQDTLRAVAGFQNYLWQDGSTASSLIVKAAGEYSVAVTDICGRVQRDTVRVTILPNPTKSLTLTLSPGSSINLGGQLYFAPDTVTVPEPSATGGCDTLTTYFLENCTPKSGHDTILFYPGQKVTLGSNTYSQPTSVTLQFFTPEGCDSTVVYTLEWDITTLQAQCPPDLTLNAPPGTDRRAVDYTLPTFFTDCPDQNVALLLLEGPYTGDTFSLGITRVCYLAFSNCGIRDTCCFTVTLLPPAEQLDLQCPPNLTVTAPTGSSEAVANYAPPSATTDCTDPAVSIALLQGLPSGAAFPVGNTEVCYEAANECGIRDSCCFVVNVLPPPPADPPCDVKSPPGCLSYELLNLRLDSLGQRRYRVRIVNTCASPLAFAYLQLPNGMVAVSPKEGATYSAAPSGNLYAVRNPNASPFYSIRYKAVMGNLNNGAGDIFEFTLPQQAAPAYLHVAARLADGSFSETYLNVLTCPVLPFGMENEVIENLELRIENGATSRHSPFSILHSQLSVWPNPTTGRLLVDLGTWQGQRVRLQVLDAQGRLVFERGYLPDKEAVAVDLPENLAGGLYFLTVCDFEQHPVQAVRFILERL